MSNSIATPPETPFLSALGISLARPRQSLRNLAVLVDTIAAVDPEKAKQLLQHLIKEPDQSGLTDARDNHQVALTSHDEDARRRAQTGYEYARSVFAPLGYSLTQDLQLEAK